MSITLKPGRWLPHRKVVRGFQYSFSYCKSSDAVSLPYAFACGVLEGAQMMTIPSAIAVSRVRHSRYSRTHHLQQMQETRLRVHQRAA
jgi:hypothetical protein